MGNSLFRFVLFKDRPNIQTMASVCFAVNSIHLVGVLYTAMSAEDAVVLLKLSGIESTVTELHIAGISRFVLYYVTIFADLFLIIGIEDNCRLAMLTFIWWNSFRIFLEVLTIVGFGIWKGTAENFFLCCDKRLFRKAESRVGQDVKQDQKILFGGINANLLGVVLASSVASMHWSFHSFGPRSNFEPIFNDGKVASDHVQKNTLQFTLIGVFLAGLFFVNVIQGYFTRCVFNYSTLVRPGIKMAGQQTEGGTSVVAHAESGTAHAPWPASGKETEFEESRHTETTKADLSTAATDDQNQRMPLTTTNKHHAE